MTARHIYDQSVGDVTKAYYAELSARGPAGRIAMNLFRAHKASSRAKKYRGSAVRDAYQKKEWSLGLLVDALLRHGPDLGITFGWFKDDKTPLGDSNHSYLLYIDLPTGQCSFHSPACGKGPVYQGQWDGMPLSDVRILRYCDAVMGHEPEDLNRLLKYEKSLNAHKGRRDAIKQEIARLAGQEIEHVEREAEHHAMTQQDLFA